MTSIDATTTPGAPNRSTRLAIAGLLLALAATAVGTFLDLTGNEPDNSTAGEADAYLATTGMALVFLGLAYGLGVRGAAKGNPSRRSGILGVLATLSVAVFWSGAPFVLASAALACALVDRDRLGSFGVGSKVGLAFSAIAAAGAVTCAIAG